MREDDRRGSRERFEDDGDRRQSAGREPGQNQRSDNDFFPDGMQAPPAAQRGAGEQSSADWGDFSGAGAQGVAPTNPPAPASGGLLDLDLDFTQAPPAAAQQAPQAAPAPVSQAPQEVQPVVTTARYSAFDDLCDPPSSAAVQGGHPPPVPMQPMAMQMGVQPGVPGVPGQQMPQMPMLTPQQMQQMSPEQLMQWQMTMQNQMQMMMQIMQSKQGNSVGQMPMPGPGQVAAAPAAQINAASCGGCGCSAAPAAQVNAAPAESSNPFGLF